MSSECMYCLCSAPAPKDEEMPTVCADCSSGAESDFKYRKWKADFDKKNVGKVLGVRCNECDDYIPRSIWPTETPPTLCYICDCGKKRMEFAAEMARWREEDTAIAPPIIKALQAVFGKK